MKNSGQFTTERSLGKNNVKWKGDKVGYYGVHSWLSRHFGKADVCEKCGSVNYVQWANLSGRYKRNRKDWKKLCAVCHRRLDGITKLSKTQAEEIKSRYKNGEKQVALAKLFSVDQGTISNIIHGKIKFYAS